MLLRHKVYASLIVFVVVPFLIATSIISYQLKQESIHNLEHFEIPMVLKDASNTIELQLLETVVSSRGMANNTLLKNWLAAGEEQENVASITEYLTDIRTQLNASSAFIVSASSNNYYHNLGFLKQINPQDDAWFYRFLESDKPYELNLDLNELTGVPTLYLNYGIYIDGKKQAVVGVSRPLDTMLKIVQDVKLIQSGHVYLVNQDGVIQLHQDSEMIGNSVAELIKDPGLSIQTNLEGESMYVATSPLKNLDWELVAEVPKRELYLKVKQIISQGFLVGGAVAIIGFLIIYVQSRRRFNF